MTPSEKFFCFPVIMYDALSFRSAVKEETKYEEDYAMDLEAHVPIEYEIGHYCTKIEEIEGWSDIYTRDMTIAQVKERGFNATEIYVKNDAPLICPLKRKEFEKLYDAFHLRMDKYLASQVKEPPVYFTEEGKNKSFFKRFLI